ncbi:hypothetical protein [Hufsiella ginkgonis]|uniref:Uncharacterized protein n=1 Tax=Hufsiella ginkgonis TaxID=2695274 RepID=A0A7K1XYL7_9SPHI|nr:hypothetical protein [Hufsiella ginkgonis]MXV16042.1 hypothetical protein [Hufsiella ginkgonis]
MAVGFKAARHSPEDIKQVREEFYVAVNNPAAADKFYDKLNGLKPAEPVLMAYYGSAQALKARYAWNPYKKLSYLKQGSKTLSAAVKANPDNFEIRFLRFSLQHFVPAFLGYSKELEEDRRQLIALAVKRQFGSMDRLLINHLLEFMIDTKRCTAEEITLLKKAMADG